MAAAGRLDVIVAAGGGDLSRSAAARLIRSGQVRIDGVVVDRPAARVAVGAQISVETPEPIPTTIPAQDLPLAIVYQDRDLAIVDKAAGMVVHPAAGHTTGTLVNALLHHLDDLSGIGGEIRPGIVHRLDRGTSGLLVVAKHDRAHRHLADQFARHTAGRTYLALCHGRPATDAGRIESWLARHPKDRIRMASTPPGVGRHAVTHWDRLAQQGDIALIRCTLETGRTHQVRVHLREQGWPLVGDRLYAMRGRVVPPQIISFVDPEGVRPLLHAWQLQLIHPESGAHLAFVAPPPGDLQGALDALQISLPEAG